MRKTQSLTTNKMSLARRLTFGFAGVSAAAIIGTAGVAAAQTGGSFPTSKADCANLTHFPQFKNHGQCISWVEHNILGHGYGGNNTVDTGVSVNTNVSGNNNVVKVAVSVITNIF
jgi:hypothetical protein